jgi:hypothetical protein
MLIGAASVADPLVATVRASSRETTTASALEVAGAVAAVVSEEQARALGGCRLTELVSVGVFLDSGSAATALKPPRGSGALAVLTGEWTEALERAVQCAGWGRARRISIEFDGKSEEVAGLSALHTAIAYIERGSCEEVLVWIERGGHVGLQQLRACKGSA